MCQATVYLAGDGQKEAEEIMRDVILLEETAEGLKLRTFFEPPKVVHASIVRIDFLKHTVILRPMENRLPTASLEESR